MLTVPEILSALKAAAEITRLRILMVLSHGELTVKDLTLVLGQSQPRISRHLKLLSACRLIDRFKDGSWVYFHLSERAESRDLVHSILKKVDRNHPLLRRDMEKAEDLKKGHERSAQSYFKDHAVDWDRLRSLYVSEGEVERAMRTAIGPGPFHLFLDLGTGTGRILELFASSYQRGIGFDVNKEMLAYARSRLAQKAPHADVRHGDLYHLSLPSGVADVVVLHQVLHYLSDPHAALLEAKRVLAPGGRLLVVDFAPHTLEFLRERHAHKRLGIASETMSLWMETSGLCLKQTKTLIRDKKRKSHSLAVSLWLAQPSTNSKSHAKHSFEDTYLKEEPLL